ncbi:MAG: GNAT family N-acetyltransferase [Acidobacteriota bacterium]|nr:GNAT family N-acetyltransferase [Acidobacteriota bacterium]
MSLAAWHEVAISKDYDRDAFDCGEPALNDFLQKHARKSHDKGGAKTFLAISDADSSILGYYSLSPASVEYARVPDVVRRGLGRYDVPAFRLARLAVAIGMQKRGLGGQLLLSAARRCIRASTEVGGTALLTDAKNERVAAWYASYGAMPLLDAPLSLLLPLATIARLLQETGKL